MGPALSACRHTTHISDSCFQTCLGTLTKLCVHLLSACYCHSPEYCGKVPAVTCGGCLCLDVFLCTLCGGGLSCMYQLFLDGSFWFRRVGQIPEQVMHYWTGNTWPVPSKTCVWCPAVKKSSWQVIRFCALSVISWLTYFWEHWVVVHFMFGVHAAKLQSGEGKWGMVMSGILCQSSDHNHDSSTRLLLCMCTTWATNRRA